MNSLTPRLNIIESEARRNWLINGDMRISQRGDFTSLSDHDYQYHLDRWYDDWSGHGDVQTQQVSTNQPSDIPNGKSWKQVVQATANGFNSSGQYIEDYKLFAGKKVIFSCYVKSDLDTPPVLEISDGVTTTTSASYSGAGAWQRLSVTKTFDGSPLQGFVQIKCDGAVTSGQFMEIAGAKFELGDVATDFIQRPFNDELKMCQRYFEHSQGSYECGWSGKTGSGAHYRVSIRYSVEKRVAPTLNLTNVETSGFASSAPTYLGNYKGGFTSTKISNSTVDQGFYYFKWTADAEIY